MVIASIHGELNGYEVERQAVVIRWQDYIE
jgi:hypothetical protein